MPPPDPVKISHKKMATKGGSIDFMFLGSIRLLNGEKNDILPGINL